MKNITIILIAAFLSVITESKCQTIDSINFKAERVTKTSIIFINGKIETVFPLFEAFKERKWSEGWNPKLIYPSTETIEEGTAFKTQGHTHNEKELLWIVTKYETKNFLIQYLVSSENRYWTIKVKCNRISENKTSAAITYAFTGLNEMGNEIDEHSIEYIYKNDLKDWEEDINYYLKNGKIKAAE